MNIASPPHQPPCPHFDVCGGCSLQHLDEDSYYEFKQNILIKTVASLRIDLSIINPIIKVSKHSRRRVEFKIAINKGDVRIGFYRAKSHDVFDMEVCLVSDERLTTFAHKLKECIQNLKKPGSIKAISLTALDAGMDATIIRHTKLQNADQEALINFVQENGVIRLNEKEDNNHSIISSLYTNGNPTISFDNHEVKLPAGAFLQATEAGQNAITKLVIKHLQNSQQIADLYSGCGTYSFPLSKTAKRIAAFEGAEDMVWAMHNSIINYGLENKMRTSIRDLFKHPLDVDELNHFDGIVINPPRNGALPQIKHIGKSRVANIVMVSCNPATFKRDAQWLINSGYTMTTATAIDQFYWSNHLEVVASFTRK